MLQVDPGRVKHLLKLCVHTLYNSLQICKSFRISTTYYASFGSGCSGVSGSSGFTLKVKVFAFIKCKVLNERTEMSEPNGLKHVVGDDLPEFRCHRPRLGVPWLPVVSVKNVS